jgi:hypothetical protein
MEELEDALERILMGLLEIIERGEEIPPEIEEEARFAIRELTQEIATLDQQEDNSNESEPPIIPPMGTSGGGQGGTPGGIQLLWMLAGGNDDAFVNYLRSIPVPEANNLLQNPEELVRVIQDLQQQFPAGTLENQSEGGIPHAQLQSSNVYGFQYSPQDGRLLVRFQGGSTYQYSGVPPSVFQVFARGAVPAKTSGSNQHGVWWEGKIPSLGAAFYAMIRNGPYAYERVA